MTPDRDQALLAAARGRMPQTREGIAQVGSFTRTRVERIIGLVIAVGCLALGAQALVAAFDESAERPGWHPALELIAFIPFLLMLVGCFVGRGQRVLSGLFVLAYVVTLVLWPIAAAGLPSSPSAKPWVFYLINVGAAAAVISFPLAGQIAATIGIPLLWGIVRFAQCGWNPAFTVSVLLDVSFALIFGGIVLTLGWIFRSAAARVDRARASAVTSYAAAAAVAATEQERVDVGALMHDSVLAALIAVGRADSPRERALAVTMAREALTRLANAERDAGMGSEAPVGCARIAEGIEAGAADLGHPLRVEHVHDTDLRVPGVVARALTLAAAQAIANAIEHADAVGLHVDVVGRVDPGRVTVRVRDRGPGFDPAAVATDRLGISASIVARMAAVGGRASIASDSGGTEVTLEWVEGVDE